MNYISISLILLFYIFFFTRAFLLTKSLGKSIKANDKILNIAILCAAISSILFLFQTLFPKLEKYLFNFSDNLVLEIVGSIFVFVGLLASSIASLNLGKSWRVGIDIKEKTKLVKSGLYKISRNPYFLAYDIVLIGISLSTQSITVIVFSTITVIFFHALILKEEKYLEDIHGDEYKRYKKETRRYI